MGSAEREAAEVADRSRPIGKAALIASVGGQRGWADWSNPDHRLRRLLAEFIGMAGLTFILSGGAAILARYGGDEFVVVLPETPPAGALVIAERLRRAIEAHAFLQAQGLTARISASFGISSYPDHALTPEGLIQKADQAMYRVKERDKNGIEVAV